MYCTRNAHSKPHTITGITRLTGSKQASLRPNPCLAHHTSQHASNIVYVSHIHRNAYVAHATIQGFHGAMPRLHVPRPSAFQAQRLHHIVSQLSAFQASRLYLTCHELGTRRPSFNVAYATSQCLQNVFLISRMPQICASQAQCLCRICDD